jgi:hypothetical protein
MAMGCSSSTARDLLHGALLLVERKRLYFVNELDAGMTTTTAPSVGMTTTTWSLSRTSRGGLL